MATIEAIGAVDYGEPWRDGRGYGAVVFRESPPVRLRVRCVDLDDHCTRTDLPCGNDTCVTAYGGHMALESCAPEVRERIILCVNALAGVSNETLRAHVERGGYARSS